MQDGDWLNWELLWEIQLFTSLFLKLREGIGLSLQILEDLCRRCIEVTLEDQKGSALDEREVRNVTPNYSPQLTQWTSLSVIAPHYQGVTYILIKTKHVKFKNIWKGNFDLQKDMGKANAAGS